MNKNLPVRSYTNLVIAEIKIPHKIIGDFLEFPEEKYYIIGYYVTDKPWSHSNYESPKIRQMFLQSKEFREELDKLAKYYKARHHFLTGIEVSYVGRNPRYFLWGFPIVNYLHEPFSYYEKLGRDKFVNVISITEDSL